MPGDSIQKRGPRTRTRIRAAFRHLALPLAVALFASGCWSQYRGNLAHSGHQSLEFAIGVNNVSTLTDQWTGATGGAVTTAPAIVDGVAYVGATDGVLYAFDATGTRDCSLGAPKACAPQWSATVGAGTPIRTSPAVAGGFVYVQGEDALFAFDARGVSGCSPGPPRSCAPLWRTASIGDVPSSPAVAADIVFTTADDGLRAYDASGNSPTCAGTPKVCEPLWSSTPFAPSRDASPTVADGTVFVTGANAMYAFSATDQTTCSGTPRRCAPRWIADGTGSSPAVVGGTVYLAGGTRGLAAYDAAGVLGCAGIPRTCAPRWTAALSVRPGEIIEPPAVAGGIAYLSFRGAIHAYDTAGYRRGSDRCIKDVNLCTTAWQTEKAVNADAVSGAPALANGLLLTGGARHLRAYDASGTTNCAAFPIACAPLWSAPARPAGYAAPAIVDGTVYAGSDDGLHAFRTSTRAPGPAIGGVTPSPIAGQTTSLTVAGRAFSAGIVVSTTVPNAALGFPSNVTPTSFTVAITIPASTSPGAYKLTVEDAARNLATRTVAVGGGTSGPEVAARAGISGFPGTLWSAPAERDADTRAVADAGADWTSLDLDWKSIQASSTDFGWTRGTLGNGGFDGAVKAARGEGLQILGVITYSPKWASPNCADQGGTYVGHCFPDAAHVDDFANFARAAVQRYGSQSTATDPALHNSITHWQIWNEPNHQEFSLPRPDPDRYADMLEAVYPAIKAADPSATVIAGGTAPTGNAWDAIGQTEFAPTTWLLSLYDRGAGESFDAIAHHPYSFPWNPLDEAGFNGFTQTRYLYLAMAAHGDGMKKVWGTEMGAPTGSVPLADPNQPCFSRSMTEAEQAQWVHDYFLGWNTSFRAFTGPLIWKAIRDDPPTVGVPLNTQLWNHLGLLRLDRTPKPAFGTFQQMTSTGLIGPRRGASCY